MDIHIRKLEDKKQAPFELMLLADPSKEMIVQYLEKGTCFVAESEHEDVIGCYVLTSNSPIEAEIMNIAVEQRFQGKGVGKKLLDHAAKYAKECGYNKLSIATANSSIFQLYLYQKMGFEMDHIEKNYFLIHYTNKLEENGIPVKHKVFLSRALD